MYRVTYITPTGERLHRTIYADDSAHAMKIANQRKKWRVAVVEPYWQCA